jgi:hypothetical protein
MAIAIAAFGAASVFAGNNDGWIYGTITARDGETYTGIMRWGTQECFWDDLFNATKDDNPWARYASDFETRHEISQERIRIFGMTITEFNHGGGYEHMFVSRFGDIKSIDVGRRGQATILMKNGTEYEVSGSGDVGETIRITDNNLDKIKLNWEEIRKIEFMPAPANLKIEDEYRLKGKVITDEMEFHGYIMWDAEECLSSDVLDGETETGDVELKFGNIRSIKRQSSQSCVATLKQGKEYELRGTNDVDNSNRGIYVEDERYGKIQVGWDQLREVIYEDNDGTTGRSYDSYGSAKPLEGTISAWGNKEYKGRIVFDLDEEQTCDILQGKLDEMEFNIPFGKIVSITPRGRHSSEVELVGGEKLRLEDSQDVSASNYGLLIFKSQDDRDPETVIWEDIEKITLTR